MRKRRLVVEDDREIAEIVRLHLSGAAYLVERAADGKPRSRGSEGRPSTSWSST